MFDNIMRYLTTAQLLTPAIAILTQQHLRLLSSTLSVYQHAAQKIHALSVALQYQLEAKHDHEPKGDHERLNNIMTMSCSTPSHWWFY